MEQSLEFSVVVFLDEVINGTLADCPEMHDVGDANELAKVLERLGLDRSAATEQANRLWADATITIYMGLLDEGIPVWRPVQARPITKGIYEVLGDTPDDEVWAFAPGTVVRCELRRLPSDGKTVIVPVGLATP